jgi:hypothetical protein
MGIKMERKTIEDSRAEMGCTAAKPDKRQN